MHQREAVFQKEIEQLQAVIAEQERTIAQLGAHAQNGKDVPIEELGSVVPPGDMVETEAVMEPFYGQRSSQFEAVQSDQFPQVALTTEYFQQEAIKPPQELQQIDGPLQARNERPAHLPYEAFDDPDGDFDDPADFDDPEAFDDIDGVDDEALFDDPGAFDEDAHDGFHGGPGAAFEPISSGGQQYT